MSLVDCLPLLEKIRARISSWKNRYLSFAGRLQLLTSVIASLTNFWISAFRLPSACIKEIEKICAAFLWSGPDLNPRKANISWCDVCRPKTEGGLGVRSLLEANKVSCYKLIWRIVSGTNSLWVNWIQRSLIRTGSFWSVKDNSNSGSWMWRKLLKYRSQAKEFHRKEVNSGTHTSFWFDSWCSLGRLYDLLGDRGYIDLAIRSTATVAEALSTHRRRRHRQQILIDTEEELERLRSRGPRNDMDISLWRCKEGKYKQTFSSKDTWNQMREVAQIRGWHKGVWFTHATPKYSFIVWLAAHNRLSTGDRMMVWNASIDPQCVLCQAQFETRNHIFFTCSYSSHVWEGLTRGLLDHRYTRRFNEILSTLSDSTLSRTTLFLSRYVFQVSIHTIWRERNRRRHGDAPTQPHLLIKSIDRIVRNRLSSLADQQPPQQYDELRTWFATRRYV